MSLPELLGLGALALVDSTSIGTLVLPVVLLLAARVHVGHFLAYLGTVVAFYAAVGLALVAGAGVVLDALAGLGEVPALRWVQLGLGVAMLGLGLLGDRRPALRRRRAAPVPAGSAGAPGGEQAGTPRRHAWRARLSGPEASYGTVVGVALVAVVLEVGTMLPFLGAVGIITTAGLPTPAWVGLVLVYNLVMIAPALLLLVARLALGRRVAGPLERFSGWLDRHAGEALYVVLVVAGLLVANDARVALGLG